VSAPGGVPVIRMPHLSHGGRRYFAKARSSAGFNPLPGGAIKAASKFLLSHPQVETFVLWIAHGEGKIIGWAGSSRTIQHG
jgi:hypothetical protein